MKFFWGLAKGVKADISRHRKREADILGEIALYEGKTDEQSLAFLNTYHNLLVQHVDESSYKVDFH